MTSLMLDDKALMGLDDQEMESELTGKQGMQYEALNDESGNNINFMKQPN